MKSLTEMTVVSAMLVQTAFVPVNSRPKSGGYAGICYGEGGSLVPSEGRGQRFESSWVRHFSAIFADATKLLLASPLALRSDVAWLFTRRSLFSPDRSAKRQDRLQAWPVGQEQDKHLTKSI